MEDDLQELTKIRVEKTAGDPMVLARVDLNPKLSTESFREACTEEEGAKKILDETALIQFHQNLKENVETRATTLAQENRLKEAFDLVRTAAGLTLSIQNAFHHDLYNSNLDTGTGLILDYNPHLKKPIFSVDSEFFIKSSSTEILEIIDASVRQTWPQLTKQMEQKWKSNHLDTLVVGDTPPERANAR